MAKIRHRNLPSTENHPIHRWEVANAVALAAIVPAVEDLGGVARQSSDGTHWILRSVSPVEWRQIDPSPEDMAGPSVVAQMAAEAARAAAEAAADTAQNASGTYADTTAGLAATASGGYFYVPDGAGGLIRYKDNAGTAVEVGRVAAGAVVSELVASVPPRSTDSAGHLDYAADQAGRIYRYTKADGGLMLAGRDESVQTRLAELDGIQVQADTAGWQDFGLDAQGRVVRAVDAEGGQRIAGRSESVQASLRRLEALASGYDGAGAAGEVVLPASGFQVGGRALRGEERYVWAGTPAALRPNQTKVTVLPFKWISGDPTYDLVVPSAVRMRQGSINPLPTGAPFNWGAEQAIAVSAPAGFFDNADPTLRRQFRDGAHLFDRANGLYYYCDSGITDTSSGWRAVNIPIFSSPDLLTWSFVGYTPNIGTGTPFLDKVWTPDWFVDAAGELYIQVAGYVNVTGSFKPWLFKCTDRSTLASWTDLGPVSGSNLPRNGSGDISATDSFMFQRNGVYYIVWTQYTFSGGSDAFGQMGISWATSLLGPYDHGLRFTAPTGEAMKGEGICVTELPPGGPNRWRLTWDNFLGTAYGTLGSQYGQMCADTNDFVTFSAVRPTGLQQSGTTEYIRNTAHVIGY